MKLAGAMQIAAPPRVVWEFILDPTRLASCIPGAAAIRQVDEHTIEGSITASVGPMQADFAFTSLITRDVYPDDLVVEMTGTDSMTRSTLKGEVAISLREPAPGTTELAYQATIKVGGRLSILGDMVLRATAGAMIDKVTSCLQLRLEQSAATSAGT